MRESSRHLGEALKEARLKAGLSQRALSLKTNISQSHLSNIEKGEVDLQASTLIEIARSLQLEPLLIPIHLVPFVKSLLKDGKTQTPKYQLDAEEEENG